MIHLSIATDGPRPHFFSSERDSIVIGRSDQCDVVLDDSSLSRQHARVYLEGGTLFIEDLGSSNGTRVNGVRIRKPTRLQPEDVIHLSKTDISVLAPVPLPQPVKGRRPHFDSTTLKPLADLLPKQPDEDEDSATQADSLRRYSDRLELLNSLHRALSGSVELDQLLEMILDGAFEHLRPTEGKILLLDPDGEPRIVASRATDGTESVPVSQTLIREVIERGQGALVDDTHSDERFAQAESFISTNQRCLLATPLSDGDGCLGMISVSAPLFKRPFQEEDLSLLASLASVAALRIRNVRLAEAARDQERLETELGIARKVQVSLLPKNLPEIPGWEIFASNTPSRVVSGDYYQAVARNDGAECVITVADVCGKGVAAALLAATTEAVASAFTEGGAGPAEVFAKTNQFLHHRTTPDKYATAFIATISAGPIVRYVNGGHITPIVLQGEGEVAKLEATGFPLGMVPDVDYDTGEIELADGHLLVVHTDGINEAERPDGEEFGCERLVELLHRKRRRPLTEIAQALTEALAEFTDGAPNTDDRTLLMLRRSG